MEPKKPDASGKAPVARRKERRQNAAKSGATVTQKKAAIRAKSSVSHKKRKPTPASILFSGVACCVVLLALALSVFSLFRYTQYLSMRKAVDRATFYPGVTVEGRNLSEQTLDEAMAAFATEDETARAAHSIVLSIADASYSLSDAKLGYHTDYPVVLESAWSLGRYGTLAQRYETVHKLTGVWARNYEIVRGFDESALRDELDRIATAASEPGYNAQITGFDVDSKGFSFKEGKDGFVVEPDLLYDAVYQKIEQGGGALTVERTRVDHGESVDALKAQFGMMASALTEGRHSTDNRLNNLRVACKAINGVCVQPGEVYSMNGTLGKRTAAKGYKAAGALENGVHTTQLGGGICQVTTTLFNAVARADLEIVEREPHSIPSTYIALGRDATVNWPNQDFKFRNNTDYPIYIVAGMNKKQQVIVQVFGKLRTDGVVVKLEGIKNQTYSPPASKIIYTSALPTGEKRVVEEKRKGYLATTYRVYYNEKGKEIDRVEMFKSYYAPAGAIIEVGK